MRKLLIGVVLLAFAAPAFADTLKEVTTKGIKFSAGGFEAEVTYTPDGKFTAAEGQVTGTWRIDGDKLCTTSNLAPDEECVAYPKDKKSGDTFDVTGAGGTATITIK
jgi:hypothetical protein